MLNCLKSKLFFYCTLTKIGDSQSSFISECAFDVGDCVITMGTGSFISVNVGAKPISSDNGLYPLVTFKLLEKEMYILHGPISSAGIDIDWAKSIGKQQFSPRKGLLYCKQLN